MGFLMGAFRCKGPAGWLRIVKTILDEKTVPVISRPRDAAACAKRRPSICTSGKHLELCLHGNGRMLSPQ